MNLTVRVGLFGFLYVLLAGLCVQMVVIPFTPLHAGNGLLTGGDWVKFHDLAMQVAKAFEQEGWRAWSLRPAGQAPAGIAALMYILTGVTQPWVVLPINALLYAIAAMSFYQIMMSVSDQPKHALFATAPLFLLPSLAIVWGQLHKDIWVLSGMLLLLAFWSNLIVRGRMPSVLALLSIVAGNLMIWLVRPYSIQIFLVGQIILCVAFFWAQSIRTVTRPLVISLLALAFTGYIAFGSIWHDNEIDLSKHKLPISVTDTRIVENSARICQNWTYTLPIRKIDDGLSALSCYKKRWIDATRAAASDLDRDVVFNSASEVVFYIPRAIQIGLFSPFPSMWLDGGLLRYIGGIETGLLYVAYLMILVFVLRWSSLKREQKTLICSLLIFSIFWILPYSLTFGNVGSIYRIRMPVSIIIMGLGILGWCNLNAKTIKRLFDVVMATCLLIVLSLPLIALYFLIKRNLGTPVLFEQIRPGLNGKPFKLVKFRSMTDERDVHGNLLPDELRLTRFGKWLRSTSLDELPELWNVIRGDMSLVGPRPLLMEYIPLYNHEQSRRHEVRPGITGWAQINGRNSLRWDERFKLDVWYVDHASLWLDIKILWRTVLKVVAREGISAKGEATMTKFEGNSL